MALFVVAVTGKPRGFYWRMGSLFEEGSDFVWNALVSRVFCKMWCLS